MTLCEVLATSDVPGGVVNVLTGRKARARPGPGRPRRRRRASTRGASPTRCAPTTELLAADDIKRILAPPDDRADARFDWLDDRAAERPEWIAAFLEMKTVWHPIGV